MKPTDLVRFLLEDLHNDLVQKVGDWLQLRIDETDDPELADLTPDLVGGSVKVEGSTATLFSGTSEPLATITVSVRGSKVVFECDIKGNKFKGVFQAQDLDLPDNNLLQDEVLYQFLEDRILDEL